MGPRASAALGDAFDLSTHASERAAASREAWQAAAGREEWNAIQRRYYDTQLADYERERARRVRAYRRKADILAAALRESGVRNVPSESSQVHDGRVLEVAAGSGLVTRFLAPALSGVRYLALDFARPMLVAARARATSPVDYVVADAYSTGLADASMDAVVGVDVLHHLDEPAAALREWLRVTRAGGTLAILETNPYHPVNLQFVGVEHEQRLFMNSPANLTSWARTAGWSGVELQTTPSFTPSGPRMLAPLLDAVDRMALRLPGARWMAALWLLYARKPDGGEGRRS